MVTALCVELYQQYGRARDCWSPISTRPNSDLNAAIKQRNITRFIQAASKASARHQNQSHVIISLSFFINTVYVLENGFELTSPLFVSENTNIYIYALKDIRIAD